MKGTIKKLSKKWCAAFLALCMVLSLAMQYGPLASFANDANPTPEELGLSRVTITEFSGFSYSLYTGSIASATHSRGLNNKYLDVDLILPNTGSVIFSYAAKGQDSGYRFYTSGGKLVIEQAYGNAGTSRKQSYTAKDLGLDSITERFNLKFGTMFDDGFGTADSCDATYVLWINDVLIDKVSYTGAKGMGSMSGIWKVGDYSGDITLREPNGQKTPEELGLTRVTVTDFDHTYKSYSGNTENKPYKDGSLNNKYLDVNLTMPEKDSAFLSFATNTSQWYGYRINVNGSGDLAIDQAAGNSGSTHSKTYTPAKLGLHKITEAFNLKFGVVFGEGFETGAACDATYYLWINDILIDKVTYSGAKNMGNNFNFLDKGSADTVVVTENLLQDPPESYGFSRVTIDQFGHSYGTYSVDSTNTAYSGGSVNHKYLDVNLEATTDNTVCLSFAATGKYTGFRLKVINGEFVVEAVFAKGYNSSKKAYTADDLGLDSINDKFNLKFGVSFPDDYATAECEATYMLWVNDVLIDKYTFSQVAVGDTMNFYANGQSGALVVSQNLIQQTPEQMGLSRVTLPDFNNASYTYKTYTGSTATTTYSGGLNNKYLDVNLTMPGTGKSIILEYASTTQGDGYRIYTESGKLVIDQAYGNSGSSHSKTYTPKELGLSAITETFNLKFGTMFGTGFGSGACDATYVLWINNVLVDKVFYAGAKNMGSNIGTWKVTDWSGSFTMSRPQYTPEEMGFSRVTPPDFDSSRYTYKTYTGSTTTTTLNAGLNNKYLDVDLIMPSTASIILEYASTKQGDGYRIYTSGGNLVIEQALGNSAGTSGSAIKKTYSPATLGLNAITDHFNLKFGTRFGDGFGTGACDASYVLWINDVLIDEVTYKGAQGMGNNIGTWKVSSTAYYENFTMSRAIPNVTNQKTPEEMGYTSVTLNDFGLADGTYQCESGNYKLSVGNSCVGSLDKKYLNVDVSFNASGNNDFIRYANNNQWEGLMVSIKEGVFCVGSDRYTLKKLGLTSLAEPFNMKLAVDFGEGYGTASCDLIYSLWINNVLVAENVELKSVANTGEILTICTLSSGGTVTVKSAGNLTTKNQSPVSYDLDKGNYLLTGIKVTVNEEEKTTGTTLSTPGDYTVVREQNFVQYVQTVSLYKLGDVDLNGTAGEASDYTALEEMLSTVKQEYKATKAAEYAADLDNDGNVGFKDLSLLKSVTEGTTMQSIKDKYHVPAITYDYLGGDDVMPIVGFNGPYIGENDLMTDGVLQLIKDSGVNMISSAGHAMGQNSGHSLKAIQMAEKYGLGYYMRDFDLNAEIDLIYGTKTEGESLSDEKFMSYLNRYASFENFLGINVIDEPTPNSDKITDADWINRQLQYYDGLGSKLNAYTNMIGFVNLYPSTVNQVNNYTTYDEYVAAVRDDMNAKLLSVDHYPFNTSLGTYNADEYFETIWKVRDAAGIEMPFWGTVQAGGDFRDDKSAGATNSSLIPNKEKTFWNVNTLLAFGAKGIQWFPLVQPEGFANDNSDDGKDYDRNGVVGADAQKTPFYDYAKEINKHIAAIDDVLMKAKSTGVMAVGTVAKMQLNGVTLTSSTDMLKNIHAPSGDGAIVGCFDYRDTEAFYVVNYDVSKAETVTLTFANNCKYKIVQNAVATYGSTTNKELSISLAAGEGVLVVIEDTVQEFSASEYATYRSATGNRVPDAEPGYIFSGWFKDADCKTAITTDTITGTAYAKFVSEDVLTVKAQITSGTNASSASSDIRFVTTVDGLDYKSVGFDVTLGGRYKKTVTSNNVYHTLFYVGSNSQVDNEYKPYKEFSTASTHFFAYTFRNMPTKSFGAKFVVTPYWVTLDGTTVYGETAVKCVNMGIGK